MSTLLNLQGEVTPLLLLPQEADNSTVDSVQALAPSAAAGAVDFSGKLEELTPYLDKALQQNIPSSAKKAGSPKQRAAFIISAKSESDGTRKNIAAFEIATAMANTLGTNNGMRVISRSGGLKLTTMGQKANLKRPGVAALRNRIQGIQVHR